MTAIAELAKRLPQRLLSLLNRQSIAPWRQPSSFYCCQRPAPVRLDLGVHAIQAVLFVHEQLCLCRRAHRQPDFAGLRRAATIPHNAGDSSARLIARQTLQSAKQWILRHVAIADRLQRPHQGAHQRFQLNRCAPGGGLGVIRESHDPQGVAWRNTRRNVDQAKDSCFLQRTGSRRSRLGRNIMRPCLERDHFNGLAGL